MHLPFRRFQTGLSVAGLLVLAACAATSAEPAELGEARPPLTGSACDSPREGCPCTTPGISDTCGSVHQVVDDRLLCSIGHITCGDDGVWGACSAERIVVRSSTVMHTSALGSPGPCADPCTPNCTTTVDTAPGLVVPSGMSSDANGLTIKPSPPPANSCKSLAISPGVAPATDIVVTSMTTPATKQFTAALAPANCNPGAPTPLWFTDKFDIAQMDAASPGKLTVAVPIAGPVTVSAALGKFTDTVNANITVAVKAKSTTNPPPASAEFSQYPTETGSETADTKLEILYPYTGTIFPLGLPSPLLQWRHGATPAESVIVTLEYPPTTPIFSVSVLATESMTAPVPLRAAQPRYPFPQSTWFAFEQTIHRNRATKGDKGRITIRRRVGGVARASKSIDVRIAPGQLKGRIYYDSYGTALAKNYSGAKQTTGGAFPNGSFGGATLVIPPGATAPTVAAGYDGTGGCYVCHGASADGATLITANASKVSTRYTFPGTAPNAGMSYGTSALNFAAINPTSTRIVTSAGHTDMDSSSRLLNLDGAVISGNNMPSGLRALYPTFATDGSALVFTYRSGNATPLSNLTTTSGKTLSMMSFNGDKTFSSFRNLVTPPEGPAVWPSFLPAGQNGVVYEVETRTTPNGGIGYTRHDIEGSTYYGATGEIWWVSTGATPVAARLHKANGFAADGASNALPADPTNGHAVVGGTMGPAGTGFYEQRYNYEPNVLPKTIGGYSWVMFTSRRAYGNVATINPYASDPRFDNISIDPTTKKLWMSAVETNPAPGTDPSAPAFYFPGQELIAGNSRAVFSLEACHPAVAPDAAPTSDNLCDSDLDCCGASASPPTAACVLDPPPLANPPIKHCVASAGNACRQTGASCLTTSNCCNAINGEVCAAGVCTEPPAYYVPVTYTRDYVASCTPGFRLRWGHFDWQSRTPSDTSIVFSAQQGDGVTFSPAVPVPFATAAGASVVAPYWATSGVKVSQVLGTPNGTYANTHLRITMSFNPSSDRGHAPTLLDWRQSVECLPLE